jgi:hypothetical protein
VLCLGTWAGPFLAKHLNLPLPLQVRPYIFYAASETFLDTPSPLTSRLLTTRQSYSKDVVTDRTHQSLLLGG